jgi:hypothetical protein
MHYSHMNARLRAMLREAGLAPEALDPWEGWKVFKAFLRDPVEGAVDDALVQFGRYDDPEGPRVHLYLARQLSDVRAADAPEFDEQFAHLVCDLAYESAALPPGGVDAETEVWSQDFPSRAAFVDYVEALPSFQALMNTRPLASAVFLEDT